MSTLHSAANPHRGALRLNGFVWGVVGGLAVAVLGTCNTHPAWCLLLSVGLNLVAAFGLCANGALVLWKLFTGQLRRVMGYVLGGTALALLLWGLNQEATLRYLGQAPGVPLTP